jgi:hypothetical protein
LIGEIYRNMAEAYFREKNEVNAVRALKDALRYEHTVVQSPAKGIVKQ